MVSWWAPRWGAGTKAGGGGGGGEVGEDNREDMPD